MARYDTWFDEGSGYDTSDGNEFDVYTGHEILRLKRVRKILKPFEYELFSLFISENETILNMLLPIWNSNSSQTDVAVKAISDVRNEIGKELEPLLAKVAVINEYKLPIKFVKDITPLYEKCKGKMTPKEKKLSIIDSLEWESVKWEDFYKSKYINGEWKEIGDSKSFTYIDTNLYELLLTLKGGVKSVDKNGEVRYHIPRIIKIIDHHMTWSKKPFTDWEFTKHEISDIKRWFDVKKLLDFLN